MAVEIGTTMALGVWLQSRGMDVTTVRDSEMQEGGEGSPGTQPSLTLNDLCIMPAPAIMDVVYHMTRDGHAYPISEYLTYRYTLIRGLLRDAGYTVPEKVGGYYHMANREGSDLFQLVYLTCLAALDAPQSQHRENFLSIGRKIKEFHKGVVVY